MSIRYCRLGMVMLTMLAGCDGCGSDGIVNLSLGDASFDVRGDGGLDGFDDLVPPDGGITGAAGADGTAATPGSSSGVAGAGAGSGFAGAGFPAGAAGKPAFGGSGGSFGGSGGSFGGTGGRPGTGGVPWTGGSGGNSSGIQCDVYSTCWHPDGTICDQNGFCCTPDEIGRCCSDNLCRPTPSWNTFPVPPAVDGPWVPPLPEEDLGAPGWRESTEVFCTDRPGNTYAHSVWSDSRGVFVATTGDGYNSADTTCPWCIKESIYLNDGTGWTEVPGTSSGAADQLQMSGGLTLTGFDNGPLVLYGYGAYEPQTNQPCSLALLDGGVRTCQPVDGVSDVHVVSSTLAYGVLNGSLIRYDGERWGPVPAAAPSQGALYMVWANDAVVMATGQMPGTIYTLRDGSWYVENTRTLEYFSAIWGFAANDVWAGTVQGGIYHYDGTAWNEIEWSGASDCNSDSTVVGMWGSGGVVYFHTTNSIGRWNGTQAETIGRWECDGSGLNTRITAVWGNSPTEVFFSIIDDGLPTKACGSAFVLYYDGAKFHPM